MSAGFFVRTMRVAMAAAAMLASLAAPAQEEAAAARRASLERQQQSDAFALQLRQSQQVLRMPASSAERQRLDALYMDQQHEQERLQQDQRRRFASEGEERGQQFLFEGQAPAWGPSLGAAPATGRWTPTLARPPRPWTPTLQ